MEQTGGSMIFLRFPDQETGLNELRGHGFTTIAEDGSERVITATLNWAIDVVGTIYRAGTFDAETGEVITPPTPRPGWHVNFIGTLPDGWDSYVVEPLRPSRVFA